MDKLDTQHIPNIIPKLVCHQVWLIGINKTSMSKTFKTRHFFSGCNSIYTTIYTLDILTTKANLLLKLLSYQQARLSLSSYILHSNTIVEMIYVLHLASIIGNNSKILTGDKLLYKFMCVRVIRM